MSRAGRILVATMASVLLTAGVAGTANADAVIQLSDQAILVADGVAVQVSVTITCPAGGHAFIYVVVQDGFNSASGSANSVVCVGRPQAVRIIATANNFISPLRSRTAHADVSVRFIDSQGNEGSGTGAGTITIHPGASNRPPPRAFHINRRSNLLPDGSVDVSVSATCPVGETGDYGLEIVQAQPGSDELVSGFANVYDVPCTGHRQTILLHVIGATSTAYVSFTTGSAYVQGIQFGGRSDSRTIVIR